MKQKLLIFYHYYQLTSKAKTPQNYASPFPIKALRVFFLFFQASALRCLLVFDLRSTWSLNINLNTEIEMIRLKLQKDRNQIFLNVLIFGSFPNILFLAVIDQGSINSVSSVPRICYVFVYDKSFSSVHVCVHLVPQRLCTYQSLDKLGHFFHEREKITEVTKQQIKRDNYFTVRRQ